MSETAPIIAGIRLAVRHAIARHLPRVLLRESIQEREGRFGSMFRATLRAVLVEVGPVTAAVHRRLERVAGALLLAELRDCGMCQEEEFMRFQEAIETLHTGMLRSQFAWWLRHCAECVFLNHWAPGSGKPSAISLEELETAYCPTEPGEVDRVAELEEMKKFGLKVARMCHELHIGRTSFYKKWLAGIWFEDSPQAQSIRAYYQRFANSSNVSRTV